MTVSAERTHSGLKVVCVALGAVLAAACTTAGRQPRASSSATERPNILIVITDDQRATGTFGVMPAVRELFEQGGTTFTHAFDTTPLCCPSRSSVMTGEYPHNHHVLTNFDSHQLDQRKTLQRYLQEAGYQTGITGKYLNHWGKYEIPPYFDKWSIFLHGEYYRRQFNLQGRITRVGRYTTSYIEDKAISYLHDFERHDGAPWYLYIGTGAPHAPFTAAPKYRSAPVPTRHPNPAVHEKDRSDKPRYVRRRYIRPRRGRIIRRQQLRSLMSVDDLVQQVFATMDRLDESRDTLAIFLSDNGFFWGEHGLKGKGPPYTQGIQVPLMVRWPGRVDRGATDDRLASTADIFPTVMAAAHLTPDRRFPVDGRSLLDPSHRTRLLIEHHSSKQSDAPTWASDRSTSYQFVEYFKGNSVVGREYYDLASDPNELHNLLGDSNRSNDPNVKLLSRRLGADRTCAGTTCP